jgi:hypothetical protein
VAGAVTATSATSATSAAANARLAALMVSRTLEPRVGFVGIPRVGAFRFTHSAFLGVCVLTWDGIGVGRAGSPRCKGGTYAIEI